MNDTSGNTVALTGETAAARRPCMKADPVWRIDLPYPSVINTWIILMVALVVMTGCSSGVKWVVYGFTGELTDGVFYSASTNTGYVGKCGKLTSEPIDHPKNHNTPHIHVLVGMSQTYQDYNSTYDCYFIYPDGGTGPNSSIHYGAPSIQYRFSYHQIKEDEFIIHATSTSVEGKKNDGAFESFILIVTTVIGDHQGFKYGIFDQVSTTTDRDQGETVTTSRGTGTAGSYGTGIAGATYGLYFGSDQRTTTTKMVGQTLTIERRHHVKFYKSKPDSSAYFDLAILKNSVARGSDYKLIIY